MRIRVLSGLTVAAAITLTACGTSAGASTEAPAADTMVDSTTAKSMSDDTMADDKMTDDSMVDDKMTDDTMADHSDDEMTDDTKAGDKMTDDSMVDHEDEAMVGPEFTHLTLTDVDGQAFTLSDFMGTPVFVETFATWCPKCESQLEDTNAAAGEVGDAATFVALSIETDISPADVANYASSKGFENVRFAVVTAEFLAAITEHYGPSAANAPSTPHFIIDSKGAAGELLTGSEDSAAIVAAVQAAA